LSGKRIHTSKPRLDGQSGKTTTVSSSSSTTTTRTSK
jgi:hypothetical protein